MCYCRGNPVMTCGLRWWVLTLNNQWLDHTNHTICYRFIFVWVWITHVTRYRIEIEFSTNDLVIARIANFRLISNTGTDWEKDSDVEIIEEQRALTCLSGISEELIITEDTCNVTRVTDIVIRSFSLKFAFRNTINCRHRRIFTHKKRNPNLKSNSRKMAEMV